MRLIAISILTAIAATSVHAEPRLQCEALAKPIEAKVAEMQLDENAKPTPQACAKARDVIKLYEQYKAQADKLNCPFAYADAQKIGGAAERADLIADMKKAHKEQCR